MKKKKMKQVNVNQAIIYFIFILIVVGFSAYLNKYNELNTNTISTTIDKIPEYTGEPYVYIDGNIPNFSESDYTLEPFETYSNLDYLGRCGTAYANICKEIMPSKDEQRGAISSIYPSGWQQTKYPGLVEGNYLYNRCHLIGYQLAGENANEKNLITGTRYMNTEGMLPFENKIAEYMLKHENNHVLYRVSPIYVENNLVASGVQMEAYSVEDNGNGICFNIYVYNIQPGITIDYSTGKSSIEQ